MGYRQLIGAGLVAALGCGGGNSTSSTPTTAAEFDAGDGVDTEAAQIQAIAAALNEFSPAVHTCWARGAADNFRLEGQVVIGLDIGEGGRATAELLEETIGDPVLTECLLTLWQSYSWPEVFAPGDRIQLPPFDFVAPTAQYSVALAHAAEHSMAAGKLTAQVLLDEANSGNGQAAMTVLTARDGMQVPLHTHTSAELLFVLRGRGQLLGIGGPQEIHPGTAVYVPAGVIHGFTHQGDDVTELVQFYAPGGPEQRFKDATATAGTTPFAKTLPKRGPKPVVRTAADAKTYSIAGGKAEVRIIVDEPISKDAAAYVGAITASVGAEIPAHRHANSSEYLLVLEGAAKMRVAGRSLVVQAGDAVQIPASVEHSATIVGAESFKALQFYAPAGPEQRFKGAGAVGTAATKGAAARTGTAARKEVR